MSKKIVIPKTPDLLRTLPSHNSYVGLSQDQLLQRVSQLHEQLNKINAYLIQTHKLSIYDYDINDDDFIEVALPSSKRGYLLDSTIKYRGDWDPVANIPKLDLSDRSKAGWAYMSTQRFDEHPVLGFIKEGDFLMYDAEGVLFNFSEILNARGEGPYLELGETDTTAFRGDLGKEAYEHISLTDNPHAVTAEQVDTYNKSTIDIKDANTLQEAKDYTYSQSEIDNKDTAVLTEAKGYTDGKISVITDLIKIDDTTITRNNNDELEVSTAILDDIESKVPKNEFETFKTTNTNKINAVENGLQIQIDEMEFVVDITLVGNDIKIEHRGGDTTYIPINEAVESGYYDTNTEELVLELANGNEIRIPSGNIVAGLASVDYVDTGLALKENKNNKITELVGVPNNTQYMSAKLTNDLIVAVRTEFNLMLDNKVDKVSGKGLSKNDFTDNDKNRLDGIESGAEVNPYSKTQLDDMFDDKVDKVAGMGLSKNDFTDEYKNKVDDTIDDVSQLQTGKQDKLTAGTNITIGENNVISASGGMATVTWQDVENKPELYDKSEIDLMLGDIESALDAILGV